MAHKDTITVGYVSVTSFCRRSGCNVTKVARGSRDVEHVIDIDNGSTLPQDVSVQTILPDAPPINPAGMTTIQFTRAGGGLANKWIASVVTLASRTARQEFATVHGVGSHTCTERIQSQPIQYRRNSSVAWETDPTQTQVLGIEVDIT